MITPMSPKTRFQILLEPEQVEALKRIQERTAAPLAAQIRRAVDTWIAENGEQKLARKEPARKGRG